MRYLVVVEKGPSSYGAHVPDLPGCIASGETKEEVLSLIREAIEFHLEDLKQVCIPRFTTGVSRRGLGTAITCALISNAMCAR